MANNRAQSLFHGYHIPFKDNELSIDYWFSGWSGKEKVFFEGNLISSKRNYSRISKHTFAISSDRYSLVTNVIRPLSGTTICSLEKNGKKLQQFTWSWISSEKTNNLSGLMKAIILYTSFFMLYGLLLHGGMYFGFSKSVIIGAIGIMLVAIIYCIYKFGDGSKPDIEEQNVA